MSDLENLIYLISKLPSLGNRSSKRIVLHLLKHKDALMYTLSDALRDTADSIITCEVCGNIDIISPCSICSDKKRDPYTICVVEDIADLWAFERGRIFNGKYHILGGTLSALDGIGPDDLSINNLIERIKNSEVKEVILATNATVDGQTTAHYVTEKLKDIVKTSRLAYGMPIGGELDYLDDGTLTAALKSRKCF